MLQTEQDTAEMEAKVLWVAESYFTTKDLQAYFEHGQWWLTVDWHSEEPRTFSVVDAAPGLMGSGLDFEEL